jgi:hypothetical protein
MTSLELLRWKGDFVLIEIVVKGKYKRDGCSWSAMVASLGTDPPLVW